MRSIFVSGGTGYLGSALIAELLHRGHRVQALARPGSEQRLPAGCDVILGNALDASTFQHAIEAGSTFVHLVGVSHPTPWKARQFRDIDLVSLQVAACAATHAAASHFIYVSVAQPAPVMREYQKVRAECEDILRQTEIPLTILRPWYVLGPGHYWPYLLLPIYQFLERLPTTRESAKRLGLVTRKHMIRALVAAIEEPSMDSRIWEVPRIRSFEFTA